MEAKIKEDEDKFNSKEEKKKRLNMLQQGLINKFVAKINPNKYVGEEKKIYDRFKLIEEKNNIVGCIFGFNENIYNLRYDEYYFNKYFPAFEFMYKAAKILNDFREFFYQIDPNFIKKVNDIINNMNNSYLYNPDFVFSTNEIHEINIRVTRLRYYGDDKKVLRQLDKDYINNWINDFHTLTSNTVKDEILYFVTTNTKIELDTDAKMVQANIIHAPKIRNMVLQEVIKKLMNSGLSNKKSTEILFQLYISILNKSLMYFKEFCKYINYSIDQLKDDVENRELIDESGKFNSLKEIKFLKYLMFIQFIESERIVKYLTTPKEKLINNILYIKNLTKHIDYEYVYNLVLESQTDGHIKTFEYIPYSSFIYEMQQ